MTKMTKEDFGVEVQVQSRGELIVRTLGRKKEFTYNATALVGGFSSNITMAINKDKRLLRVEVFNPTPFQSDVDELLQRFKDENVKSISMRFGRTMFQYEFVKTPQFRIYINAIGGRFKWQEEDYNYGGLYMKSDDTWSDLL
jgi:hypothetical protein